MKFNRSVLFGVLPIFLLWGVGSQPQGSSSVALIVPVTESAVKLAFDVAKLRSADILTYERDHKGEAFLHAWDGTASEWREVSIGDLSSGQVFPGETAQMIVIGPPKGLPTDLARALTSVSGAKQIPTLESAIAINKLDGVFNFSGKEWRWLADRHGLNLFDRNQDRRRWGKYGPPEGKTPTEPPIGANLGSKDLVPVEVVDVTIDPTEIKVPDDVERSPRLIVAPGKELQITGGTVIEMDVVPVADEAAMVSNVADEKEPAEAASVVEPVPEALAPSDVLDDEAPVLELSSDSK